MKKPYRFWIRNKKFYVCFAHTPNKWISTGCTERDDAVRWAEAFNLGKYTPLSSSIPTLKKFCSHFFIPGDEIFLKRIKKKNKTFRSAYFKENQGRIDNYILPSFGDRLISSINSIEIDNWFVDLKSIKNNKPLSDNSKNKILNTFKVIMKEATYRGLIEEDPCDHITMITEENKTREPFNDEEINKLFPNDVEELLKIWQGLKWSVFFLIMRDTGFRPGEVAGLLRESYYPELNGIYTTGSIDPVTGNRKDSLKTTNKGKKYKLGLLEPITQQLLDFYLEQEKINSNSLIFPAKNTQGHKPESSLKHFKASVERAGVPLQGRTQYSLRHSFETSKLKSLDSSVVQELMGHTRYRSEYDHRTGEDRLEKVQKALLRI